MSKASNKILSLALAAVMVFTMLPGVTVYAEDSGVLGTSGVITAFDALSEDVATQSVTLGTSREALSLPETLTATITSGAGLLVETGGETDIEDEAAPGGEDAEVEGGEDEATPTDADEQDDTDLGTLEITVQIPVTWQSEPEYDPDTFGAYVFTAEIPDEYTVADGVTLPVITVQLRVSIAPRILGVGTESNPLVITTALQLYEFAQGVKNGDSVNGIAYGAMYVELGNDIDLSAYGENFNNGEGWTPIGTDSSPFTGSFDGKEYEITGLYISRSGISYQGLFGYIDGGTVKNLGVVDCEITGNYNVGGVAGYVGTGSVTSCYVTGSVSGASQVGGVAGNVNNGGSVTNCYSTGAVSGTAFVGGVAGYVSGGSVTNCYATGAVSGTIYVGGVAGSVGSGSVISCAALNESVTASSDAGRVAGYVSGSYTLSNNYAHDGMTVTVSGSPSTPTSTDATSLNGADMTAAEIIADGTLKSLFTNGTDGWTTATGSLPGLFGNPVDIPAYIVPTSTAYFAGGDGTSGDPYQIKTPAQLAKLAELVNAGTTGYCESTVYYKLMNGLDLSAYGASYDSGAGWTPIGTNTGSNYFKGSFDGGGYKITGLYINRSSDGYQSLFGYINGGTVKNLGVVDCAITGAFNVGGVAGYVYYGSVTNCYATGSVSGNNYVGGVAGEVYGGSVANCYATGAVSGYYSVGGVAGAVGNGGSVTNCYATGAVNGTNRYVGGVAGYVYEGGRVTNCAALNESVTASGDAGRVVGYVGSNVALTNNYAYSGMTVTVNGGGKDISATSTHDKVDGADITADAIKAIPTGALNSLFTSANGWKTENGYLPGLFGELVTIPAHISANASPFAGGDGTELNPYQIKTPAQLAKLAELVNAGTTGYCESTIYYKLMNDLDLSGYQSGAGWTPIGTAYNYGFKGTFDGVGHEITGLYINRSSTNYQGLFGYINGGTVTNVGVVACDITGSATVGGVAGYVSGGSVTNCYSTGSVSGTGNNVGGVAGYVFDGNVTNCYSTGSVSGSYYVGGVAGAVTTDGSVTSCYATGAVSGTGNNVGGVAGAVEGSVENCYATGSVSGSNYVGGVAGYVNIDGSVENCYATGTVSGTGNNVGGVAGSVTTGGSVTNCAALNPSVTASGSNAGRVAGYVSAYGTLSNNYAYDGMTVSTDGGSPSTTITTGTVTNKDGADITKAQIASPAFWASGVADNTMGWSKMVWTFAQGYLPVLIGLAGQNGDMSIYLTAFPTGGLTVTPGGTGVTGSTGAYSVPYSSYPQPLTVTVTGMEEVTLPKVEIAAVGNPANSGITITPSSTNGSATITIPAGYVGEITITSTLTNDIRKIGAATLAVDTYTATVSQSSHTFTAAAYGYTQQTAETFTITNTGTGQLTNVAAALSSSSDFEISTALSSDTISTGSTGNTATVSVRPKTGLAAGTYTDTLTVTGDNGINLTVNLSFTVSKAGQTISGVSAMTKTYGDVPFTISPSAPENPVFTFSSSNTSVATISSGGVITIIGAGTSNITVNAAATANYGLATTAFTLTVNKAENAITGLSAISATYGGNPVTVTPVANGSPTFSYSSSDTNVAAVDANGVVTIVGAGSAVITVTAAATANYKTATATFSVNVSQSGGQIISGLQDYDVTYGGANFTLTPFGLESPAFSYASDNQSVATVDANGVVTIAGAGTAVITVTAGATASYAGTSAVCVVTVDKAAQTLTGLQNLTKTYGDGNFTVTLNSNAAAETPNISFQSSNIAVIDFDASENFVIKGAGTATITVLADDTSNYKSATAAFDITVNQKQLTATYTAANKAYDGSTAASVTVTLIGVIVGDDVSATADGTFSGASVGTGITVTVSNVRLTGSDAGNYIAPAAVNTTANITRSGGSSGGGSSSSSDSDSGSTTTTRSGNITVNKISVPYSATSGVLTSTITAANLRGIVDNAYKNEDGSRIVKISCNGVSGSASLTSLTLTFNATQLKADEDVTFIIETPYGVLIYTTEQMLQWFGGGFGTYTITLEKSSLKVGITKDGKSVSWNALTPMARIGVAYTTKTGENTANIAVTDKNGRVLPTSVYEKGMVYADIFATGTYKAEAITPTAYTDITGHWANASIDYVTMRGLISGASATAYSPGTDITRADYLMALGKLSGADVSGYMTSSFTDVSNSSAAMPYIEWAAANGIVQGVGSISTPNGVSREFAPDANITREEMALMMTNYTKTLGYTLPAPNSAAAYADSASISAWAKDAVPAMRKADIMTGKDGNIFDPQGSTTRAEAATILRRFVENVISSRDAEGWSNANTDLNKRVYYNQNGNAITGWRTIDGEKYNFGSDGLMRTGWQTIDDKRYYFDANGKMIAGGWAEIGGKWYYFYTDGTLAVNTTIDGYEVGTDGALK